jgi:hypothetical protein
MHLCAQCIALFELNGGLLLGTPDRMSEFLVMLRHRLGWPDVRSVLYADLRPQAHEKVKSQHFFH